MKNMQKLRRNIHRARTGQQQVKNSAFIFKKNGYADEKTFYLS